MRSRTKQRLTLYDLGRIPVTPVVNKSGYEDSNSLLKRLQKEEKDAAAAAERAAFLKSPEGQLRVEMGREADAINAAVIASIRKGQMTPDSIALGGYTTREFEEAEKHPELDKLAYFSGELDKSFAEFSSELDQRGIDFKSPKSMALLVQFFITNVFKGGVAITPENWMRSLQRLWDLGILDSTMVTGMEKPAIDQVNEPEETEAQRQRRIASEIERGNNEVDWVNSEMRRDWQNMYRQFAEFMEVQYSVNVLQQRIVDFAVAWAEKWNKNLGDPRHLNELRRALDYQQLLGPRGHLLTPDERTARALEDTPLTTATFETRQDIVSRLNGLKK